MGPADETRRQGESLLPDGTPFFGRLGEVAYDSDEDRVQCHLCGGWFRHVSSSHLYRTHGWTLAEYRDAFRLPMNVPLCGRGPSNTWRAGAEARIGQNGFALGHAGKGTSKDRVRPWHSLASRAPELLEELHPTRNRGLDPAKVAWAAHHRVWWRCRTCWHEWAAVISSRTSGGRGCPRCARRRGAAASSEIKRRVPHEKSVAAIRPDLLELWHSSRNGDLDPATVAARSSQRVWWCCPACGREWESSINNRVRAKHSLCPTCARRRGAGVPIAPAQA